MKKIIVLLASVFMLQACDDGDITLESFNFDTVAQGEAVSCKYTFKNVGKSPLEIRKIKSPI